MQITMEVSFEYKNKLVHNFRSCDFENQIITLAYFRWQFLQYDENNVIFHTSSSRVYVRFYFIVET